MTDADKMALLRTLAKEEGNPPDDDTTLYAYLTIAGDYVIRKAYPYRKDVTEVPGQYAVLQCRIAAHLLHRRGTEGETRHSENGYDSSFEDGDIPPSLARLITPYAYSVGASGG